jgi:hypothetical protein
MKGETRDRHSVGLLVALLFFLMLSAFLGDDRISEAILVLSMYAILIVVVLKASGKRNMPWPALLLTATSLLIALACVFYPIQILRIASRLLVSAFFGYASVTLFSFLERSGAIIRAKLVACTGPLPDIGDVLLRCLQPDARDSSRVVCGGGTTCHRGFAPCSAVLQFGYANHTGIR